MMMMMTLQGWGEWRVGQLTEGGTDWFSLRVPYDCSSLVHYYQLQGARWTDTVGRGRAGISNISNFFPK